MRVTVILAEPTPRDLPGMLHALRYQTYPEFDVLLAPAPGVNVSANGARVIPPLSANPSLLRNSAVAAAAGDVVAFLEPGCVPDPRWLEELVGGYDAPEVAAVGGEPGSLPAVSARTGDARIHASAVVWGHDLPGGLTCPVLPAHNVSFRCEAFLAAGGPRPSAHRGPGPGRPVCPPDRPRAPRVCADHGRRLPDGRCPSARNPGRGPRASYPRVPAAAPAGGCVRRPLRH